eukprot:3702986-Rhodomonas_salina.1
MCIRDSTGSVSVAVENGAEAQAWREESAAKSNAFSVQSVPGTRAFRFDFVAQKVLNQTCAETVGWVDSIAPVRVPR